MSDQARKPWTRDQLLILLNLYDKIPFGKFDQSNPVLIDVAERMERTPGSIAMKLSNLASLDERLAARGIKGLTGASALDRTVWAAYRAEPDSHAIESEGLLSELMTDLPLLGVDVDPERGVGRTPPLGSTESMATVKVRRGQAYFRQVVLNAYGSRCAVTGLAVRELLVASHIVPWMHPTPEDPHAADMIDRVAPPALLGHRLDLRNGIALNALHDQAFDQGFITFDEERRMVCCKELHERFNEDEVGRQFKTYEGKPLIVPDETEGPAPEYLAWHRTWAFREG